jgi:hypothetical protein
MNLKKISKQKKLTGNNPQQRFFTEEPPATKLFHPTNSTSQELEHKFRNHIHEELKLGSVVSRRN